MLRSAVCAAAGVVLLLFPAQSQGQALVGELSGDTEFLPADGGGTFLGAGFLDGQSGAFLLDDGEVQQLIDGTGPRGRASRPAAIFGGGVNSFGGLTIVGPGTTMELLGDDNAPFVAIGENGGSGTASITDGAALRIIDLGLTFIDPVTGRTGSNLNIGDGDGSTGIVDVDGSTIRVESTSRSRLVIGEGTGAIANMTISNGSDVLIQETASPTTTAPDGASVTVGRNGPTATLQVTDSSVTIRSEADFADFVIGEGGNTNGSATVAGPTASVELDAFTSAEIVVGRNTGDLGRLTLSDGATVTADGASSRLRVADLDRSTGIVTIESGASLHLLGPDGLAFIGQFDPGTPNGGDGIVEVTGAGSALSASRRIEVGQTEGVGSSSGLLLINDMATVAAPEIVIGAGGIVAGNGGTLLGNAELRAGGFLAPGLSPGTLTIDGDLTLSGGTLELEIGGRDPGQFDVLSVLGDVFANDPFRIELSFLDGFLPDVGETFEVMDFANVVGDIATLADIDFLGLGSASAFSLVFGDNGRLLVRADAVTPIPLPAPMLMLLTALAGLLALRRRTAGPLTF